MCISRSRSCTYVVQLQHNKNTYLHGVTPCAGRAFGVRNEVLLHSTPAGDHKFPAVFHLQSMQEVFQRVLCLCMLFSAYTRVAQDLERF